MRIFSRSLCCLLLGVLAQASGAEESVAGSEQAERVRIETQRQQELARFDREERSCASQFAVNDCLQSVKARRREVLADLRRQETSLNDARRRRQGALQVERTESKLREAAVADSPAAKASAGERLARKTGEKAQTQAQQDADAKSRALDQARKKKQFAEQQAQREAKAGLAAKNQREHEKKLAEAAQHKAELLERQKKATQPAAKPLPDRP